MQRLRSMGVTGRRAYSGGARAGDVEYRFGYWMLGQIGRARGRWVWGQFSPMISERDLDGLLAKAKADRTIRTRV